MNFYNHDLFFYFTLKQYYSLFNFGSSLSGYDDFVVSVGVCQRELQLIRGVVLQQIDNGLEFGEVDGHFDDLVSSTNWAWKSIGATIQVVPKIKVGSRFLKE